MFSFRYVFFFPFVCPNPSQPSFMWDWGVLSAKWELYLLGMFLLILLVLGLFYFGTKPNRTGVRRFVTLTISLFIFGGIVAWYYLSQSRDILFTDTPNWTFEHTLVSMLAGLGSTIELYIISLIIFLIASQLPIDWQLRAMRRYPFKFVP